MTPPRPRKPRPTSKAKALTVALQQLAPLIRAVHPNVQGATLVLNLGFQTMAVPVIVEDK